MPANTEIQAGGLSAETPNGFFNSAFMEIESYFDFPAGDAKSQNDSFRSPRLTPSTSPQMNPDFRPSPGVGVWNNLRDSPGSPGFQTFGLDGDSHQSQCGIAPMQTTNAFVANPSPPNSSGCTPDKYVPPGDISPLDSLLSSVPHERSRAVHGQVTPPEDIHKSPDFSRFSESLTLNSCLTPPERSPVLSPRQSPLRQRQQSITEDAKPNSSSSSSSSSSSLSSTPSERANRRRRSSTATTTTRSKRKNSSVEDQPDIQEAKRRRFLERNRVAASKCRQKKKAWMQDLESEAREAQNMSKQLKTCVSMLKEEILQLKNELLKHNTCECVPIRQYLSNEAIRLAGGDPTSKRMSNASEFSYTSNSERTDNARLNPEQTLSTTPEFELDFGDP